MAQPSNEQKGVRPDTYRAFVAISLPEQIKDEIESAQEKLRRALPDDCVRWTKREQFHLTLKFLGNVDVQRLPALKSSLSRASERFGPLPLRAAGIGLFSQHRPRVVFVHVQDGQERLALLQRALEGATAGFTSERPERTFTGHITLGRCKKIQRTEARNLAMMVESMEHRRFGEWTADRIELVRSEIGSDGSRYTILGAMPLAAG